MVLSDFQFCGFYFQLFNVFAETGEKKKAYKLVY